MHRSRASRKAVSVDSLALLFSRSFVRLRLDALPLGTDRLGMDASFKNKDHQIFPLSFFPFILSYLLFICTLL